MKKFILFIIIYSTALSVFAQEREIDSLLGVLKLSSPDTQKVELLLTISRKYSLVSPESSIDFANQAKVLAEKLNYQKGIAYALKNIGIVYYKKSIYADAITNW